jgi:hypothetical protein
MGAAGARACERACGRTTAMGVAEQATAGSEWWLCQLRVKGTQCGTLVACA